MLVCAAFSGGAGASDAGALLEAARRGDTAQVASLQLQPCTAFEPLRADAAPPEQAYADYLAGRATPAQAATGGSP